MMVEINTTHNSVVTLLRQMDSLPVKDFRSARTLTETYAELVTAWGYDLTDTETLGALEANADIVVELPARHAREVMNVIESVIDSGTLNGFGARLLMQLRDEVENQLASLGD